jgi:hypothetical protein
VRHLKIHTSYQSNNLPFPRHFQLHAGKRRVGVRAVLWFCREKGDASNGHVPKVMCDLYAILSEYDVFNGAPYKRWA